MAFFEQLGKRITDTGQGVVQQTKNFADVTRLNSEVSDMEKKIAQLYASIGQAYYERHQEDPAPEHRQEVEEIRGLVAEIARRQEEIKQIRGIVKCPSCGADVPVQAAFCNACGAKMVPASPAAEPPAGDAQLCPACGAAPPRATASASTAVQNSMRQKPKPNIRRDNYVLWKVWSEKRARRSLLRFLRRAPGDPEADGNRWSRDGAHTRRDVQAQDSGKYKKIGIAAVAAVVVVLVIAAVSLLGGRSDTATAERFFDAVFNADAEAIVDLIPPDLIEAAIEESGYSRAEVEEEFQQMASEMSYASGRWIPWATGWTSPTTRWTRRRWTLTSCATSRSSTMRSMWTCPTPGRWRWSSGSRCAAWAWTRAPPSTSL